VFASPVRRLRAPPPSRHTAVRCPLPSSWWSHAGLTAAAAAAAVQQKGHTTMLSTAQHAIREGRHIRQPHVVPPVQHTHSSWQCWSLSVVSLIWFCLVQHTDMHRKFTACAGKCCSFMSCSQHQTQLEACLYPHLIQATQRKAGRSSM
jgi:hypothetical protein